MIEASAISADLDDETLGTLRTLFGQLEQKRPRNKRRLDRYDGKHALRDLGISTPPSMRRLGVVLGWPSKAVDMLNNLCTPMGFALPGVDVDSLGVGELWERNDLQLQLIGAERMSQISSVSWLVTTRGVGDEPAVVWQVKDALNGTGVFNTATRRLDAFLSITARNESGDATGAVLYLPGRNVVLSSKAGTRWDIEDDATTSLSHVPVEPMPFRPDVMRPFGHSRISREVEYLTDAAMRALLRSEVSAEFYSFPQRWAMGADSSDFMDENGNYVGRWQTLMGGMLAIGKDEDGDTPTVGQFTSGSQQPHMDQLGILAQAFAGATAIPVASLGVGMQQANPTSADAYITGLQDLIREAKAATRVWGHAAKRAMLTSLQLLNGWGEIPAEMWRLKLDYDDPAQLPANTAADNLSKITAAMPWFAETDEAIDMLGLDEVATENLKMERRRARSSSMTAALAAVSRTEG